MVKCNSSAVRTLSGDIAKCYKILIIDSRASSDKHLKMHVSPQFTLSTESQQQLYTWYKLYKPRCNSVRMHFFTNRVLEVWISLPERVAFSSLGAFKRSVRIVEFSKFFK